jgi:hypothetical protein
VVFSRQILTLIFEHVPDLAQVRLTCKSWLNSSQEQAFNKVVVSQENIVKFVVVAETSPYRIGDHARILHLCCSKNKAMVMNKMIHWQKNVHTFSIVSQYSSL